MNLLHGIASPISETEPVQPSKGISRLLNSGRVARAQSSSPSCARPNSVSSHGSKALLEGTSLLESVDVEISVRLQSENVTRSSVTDSYSNSHHSIGLHRSDSISTYDGEDAHTERLLSSETNHQESFSACSTPSQQMYVWSVLCRISGPLILLFFSSLGDTSQRPGVRLSSNTLSPPARLTSLPGFAMAREARMASVDHRSEQLSVIETRTTVEQEVDTDDEQGFDYSKDVNRFVVLIAANVLAHWLVLGHREHLRWR